MYYSYCPFLIFNICINTYLPSCVFQIRVVASDGGSPSRNDVTYVEVTVLRETGVLAFTLPAYSVVISENTVIDRNILVTLAQPGVRIHMNYY